MTTRGSNPDYQITVSCPSQKIQVVADMSEDFAYALASHYDTPANSLTGVAGELGADAGKKAGELSQAAGGDAVFKFLTKKIYRGTSPVSFTLRLLFDALYNSKQDVQDTCTILGSLVLPGDDAGGALLQTFGLQGVASSLGIGSGGLLTPPNPTHLFSSANRIDIRIGRMFYWSDMVIESAHIVEECRLDNTGFPIAGAIDMSCASDFVYSKNDLANAAGLGSAGVSFVTSASNALDSVALRNQLRSQ